MASSLLLLRQCLSVRQTETNRKGLPTTAAVASAVIKVPLLRPHGLETVDAREPLSLSLIIII